MTDRIREAIDRYLSGAIDADDLAADMPDPWELQRADADETMRRLVLRIIGYVTEFQNGDSSESDLQDRLRLALPSARTYRIMKDESTVVSGAEFVITTPVIAAANERSPVVECV